MRREGCDEENVQPEDFICDFCGNHWTESRPMVEGHRGTLMCGHCLTEAYTQVVVQSGGATVPDPIACTLCLMHHESPHWKGQRDGTYACTRCIKQSAGIMQKDPDSGWKKPG